MKYKDAKALYQNNVIVGFDADRDPNTGKWRILVQFDSESGAKPVYLVNTFDQVKEYSKLDTALREVENLVGHRFRTIVLGEGSSQQGSLDL